VKRREFIAGLGTAATWPALRPLAADAQQPRGLPTIGFLGAGTSATAGPWAAVFIQRLRELGWIEDRTIKIDLRWADGRIDRSAEIAADFVRLKVDVIVTYSNQIAEIAKQATAAIPIVVTLAADPVGTGLVNSLARPGGNLTGLSAQNVDLAGKRFELLREVVPGLRRLAVLFNVESIRNAALELESVRNVALPLGVDVITSEIRPGEDIAPAFAAIKAAQADALFVFGDSLTLASRTRIRTLALAARLPTIHSAREFVEAGGLMSYGPNYPNMFRRAAEYVDKILRGTNPSELPVEQPNRYDLIINLTTAKALGLNLPPTLLALADEVIE
jgi:putative tryptophan/tyrosine transport system substrate-binding protein